MFKPHSSSSGLVITSRWFATSRLAAPAYVRLIYCAGTIEWNHPMSVTLSHHSRCKSMDQWCISILLEAPLQCMKYVSRPSYNVLWWTVSFVEFCLAFFQASADFFNRSKNSVLHLCWSHSVVSDMHNTISNQIGNHVKQYLTGLELLKILFSDRGLSQREMSGIASQAVISTVLCRVCKTKRFTMRLREHRLKTTTTKADHIRGNRLVCVRDQAGVDEANWKLCLCLWSHSS